MNFFCSFECCCTILWRHRITVFRLGPCWKSKKIEKKTRKLFDRSSWNSLLDLTARLKSQPLLRHNKLQYNCRNFYGTRQGCQRHDLVGLSCFFLAWEEDRISLTESQDNRNLYRAKSIVGLLCVTCHKFGRMYGWSSYGCSVNGYIDCSCQISPHQSMVRGENFLWKALQNVNESLRYAGFFFCSFPLTFLVI